jgi:hypothetical protein
VPKLSDAEIADLISKGELGSVCIDTTVAHRTGYDLEAGSLIALAQFAKGPISFLIPDIVAGEIKAHMLANAQQATGAVRSAIRELRNARRPTAQALASVEGELGLADDLTSEIEQRWDAFVASTSAEIITAGELLNGDALVDAYFQHHPPFEATGKKKAEFPDAIALLELEARGERDQKYVLAVSTDDGWAAFADRAKWVIVMDDLPAALGHFHRADTYVVGRAISMLDDPENFILANELGGELTRFVEHINPDIDATSYHFFEADFLGAEYRGHSQVSDDDVTIIDSDDKSVTLSFPLTVQAEVSADFTFSIRDSIDRDYVSIGSSELTRQVEIEVEVVLQVDRESGPADGAMTLKVDAPMFVPIDFGEVEPDLGPYEE